MTFSIWQLLCISLHFITFFFSKEVYKKITILALIPIFPSNGSIKQFHIIQASICCQNRFCRNLHFGTNLLLLLLLFVCGRTGLLACSMPKSLLPSHWWAPSGGSKPSSSRSTSPPSSIKVKWHHFCFKDKHTCLYMILKYILSTL